MAKIGIEWVQKYHGRASSLSNTKAQAEGFYNKLSATRAFNYGNDSAWDSDFEESGVGSPSSGGDALYTDTVHMVFFSGHGSSAGPLFGVANHDDGRARPSEIRLGNGTLNWVVFDACEVLRNDHPFDAIDRWRSSFAGLHAILGFVTTSSDEDKRGKYLAENLNDGQKMHNAWRNACEETEDSDTRYGYLYAEGSGTNVYKDHWHGKGHVSADPTNPTAFVFISGTC